MMTGLSGTSGGASGGAVGGGAAIGGPIMTESPSQKGGSGGGGGGGSSIDSHEGCNNNGTTSNSRMPPSNQETPLEQRIYYPHRSDVLLGRGKPFQSHPGRKRNEMEQLVLGCFGLCMFGDPVRHVRSRFKCFSSVRILLPFGCAYCTTTF